MLTPDQIEALRIQSGQIISPVIEFLISDIASRIAEAGQLTSTAAYQIWRAQNLGFSQRQLKKELRKRLKVSHRELRKLLTQAAEVGYDFDIKRFPFVQAVPFDQNESLQRIVETAANMADENFTNLTQTMGFVTYDGKVTELTDAYRKSCDFAFEKAFTGAQDYNSAIRQATKGLAEKGIQTIDYESGTHRSLEAAVRGNFMGGINIMSREINQQNHDMLGCDGWEISAHRGSAPDHEPFQGKQYSDEEFQKIQAMLVRDFESFGCGHSGMGIILGINEPQYTPEELEEMRRENEQGIDYDGKHYTLYKATQHQRGLERTLRKQKRKILIDEKTGDKEKLAIDQTRYVIADAEYKRFSKAAGLRLRHERANVPGFGAKQHSAAESGYKKRVTEVGEATAMQNWHAIPVAGGQTGTKYRRIKSDGIDADNVNAIIDANVKNTNPAYKSGGPAYGQNCQRCVAAYEMRRRGYDVIAKPAIVNENGLLSRNDPLYYKWDKIFSGAKFLRCPGEDGGMADIIERMGQWGDGAVAEVKVQWDAVSAHVFVAERVNGMVRFVDPQTGDTNCGRYFTNAVNGATMVARIDDLEPTELIEKCIKNRGGKQ